MARITTVATGVPAIAVATVTAIDAGMSTRVTVSDSADGITLATAARPQPTQQPMMATDLTAQERPATASLTASPPITATATHSAGTAQRARAWGVRDAGAGASDDRGAPSAATTEDLPIGCVVGQRGGAGA